MKHISIHNWCYANSLPSGRQKSHLLIPTAEDTVVWSTQWGYSELGLHTVGVTGGWEGNSSEAHVESQENWTVSLVATSDKNIEGLWEQLVHQLQKGRSAINTFKYLHDHPCQASSLAEDPEEVPRHTFCGNSLWKPLGTSYVCSLCHSRVTPWSWIIDWIDWAHSHSEHCYS